MTYRPATERDRPALTALLTQAHLSVIDLPADLSTFLLALTGEGQLVGSAGLDLLDGIALLRSVAVLPDFQGQYIGQTLVDGLTQAAEHNGLTALYLLTTTADGYFEQLGFVRISRDDVPESVKQTRQFSDLCPDSAVAMQLDL